MLEKELQPNTINTYMRQLCQCLLEAKRRKLIPEYPCEGIGSLQEGQPQIDPFSFDELKHWLDYLKKKNMEWHDLILFWSRTGLRPGELYALRWEHIDYFNRKALIREAKRQNGSTGLPKTKYSIRDVDLRPPVIEAIKRQEVRTLMLNSFSIPHSKTGSIYVKDNARAVCILAETSGAKASASETNETCVCDPAYRGRRINLMGVTDARSCRR